MKRLSLCFGLLFVASASARADEPKEPTIDFTTFTLPNGLQVILIPDHQTPQIAIVTWFKVGSKDEAPGRTGFAHLYEHLMFKGSPHVPDGQIDRDVEEAGGWTNAFTANDETVYEDFSSSSWLERALWYEADRIAGLPDAIDQPKLDNQREVVLNERRQSYENEPYGIAEVDLAKNLWPEKHPYHWPVIGYAEDLRAAALGDVKAFFRTNYLPNNAVMAIAGDINPADVKPLVEKYLSSIPRGPDPVRPAYPDTPPLDKDVIVDDTDAVQAARVYYAWRGPKKFSADEPALHLAAAILAEGKSSRLYKRLVYQDRIAEDVSASFEGDVVDGTFMIVATAKPGVDASKLKAAIDDELGKFLSAPPSADELERAKNDYEAHRLEFLEALVPRAEQVAAYAIFQNDPGFLGKDLARYRAVEAKPLCKAAENVLRKGKVLLTIRPRPDSTEGGK
jgi:zinc protease